MTDSSSENDLSSAEKSHSPDLASRWARLGGFMVDAIVVLLLVIPIHIWTGYWPRMMARQLTPVEIIEVVVFGFLVFLILNASFLKNRGQTIGKIAVGTRIVSAKDNTLLPLWKLIVVRNILVQLASLIPFIGSLVGPVDWLLIFRTDRRCLHDHLAGSKVIVAS